MKPFYFLISNLLIFQIFAAINIEGTYEFPKKTTHLQIYKTGDVYEGKISWIKDNKKDDKNPDLSLRNRDIQGAIILKNLKLTGENVYTEGEAYDPESGRTYRCNLWFNKENPKQLNIRGYIGIPLLGRSEVLNKID